MAKVAPRFFILHGEDDFSRKDHLLELRTKMNDPSGLNISIMDGTQTSAQSLINTASSFPFLSDTRLVIVNGMLDFLGSRKNKDMDFLVEQLPYLPEFTHLIFHETRELPPKNPVLLLAQGHDYGKVLHFAVPKDLETWVFNHAKTVYGIEIERRAAHALVSVIGKDLRVADSELAKLAAYVNFEGPITENHVAAMTPYVADAVVFDMVDALGQRDGKKALGLTQALLNQGNDPLGLLAMINRQYRLLILAKEYLQDGGNPKELGKIIGVHPFVGEKIAAQARRYASLQVLEKIYRELAKVDHQIKRGKMSDEMALQIFIATVTS